MNYFTDHFKNVIENFKDNKAVGYWDEENIYKSLTYQNISDISLRIVENLKNVITEKYSCIGLFMQKNHYIPSLLIRFKVRHKIIRIGFTKVFYYRNLFKVTERDVIYFGTPLTFDPSMVEIFLALTTGCTLIIPPKTVNSRLVLNVLFPNDKCHNGITILQIVPSLLLHWNDADVKYLLEQSSCRILAFGGEKFPEVILKLPRLKNLKIFNLYGITEVSCWASAYEIINDDYVTLGNALPDTILEVRDDTGSIITDGKGELFIGSYSRICYLNDEDTSSITKPVFRATGDYVQIKNDTILYLGRINSMIKRLGHKVNLLEVQECVFQHTAVPNVCIWYEDERKLVLFAAIKEFDYSVKQRIVDKLRIKLLQVLPREYFPDHIEIIPSIPLSDHGKIDTRTLESLYRKLIYNVEEQSTIDVFKLLWCKYLGLSINSIEKFTNCTFFELGGNSITVIQYLSELKHVVDENHRSELTTLLFEKTLKECCNFISHLQPVPYRKFVKKRKRVDDQLRFENRNSIKMNIAWKYDLEACVDSTPTVWGERVSIGSFSHKFVTLDTTTGSKISETILSGPIESACCVIPSTTYVCTGCYDGYLYCIDTKTGLIVWKYKSGDQIKCTPVVYEGNNSITFGSYDKILHCVNFNNGNLIWKKNILGSVTSNPIIYNEQIYLATTLGNCFCVSVCNGEQIWKHDTNVPIFGSPAVIDRWSLVGWITVTGTLNLFSHSNGEKSSSFQVDGNVFSGLSSFGNIVLFGCSNHKMYCVRIDENSCQLCYVTTLDSSITSTPYLFGYLRTTLFCVVTNKGGVYIINFECGTILGHLQLDGEIFSSPRISNSMLYIGCRDNNLYCIKFN
ncbi:hypothetical protein RI129_007615 [Pyrocoelia pectoralis]|uniref:Acyl-CoA synthetase n=1 Tax=Pyrocoelia pectoralis TaxID=417401 RepID=A0AAN7V8C9_9COLE